MIKLIFATTIRLLKPKWIILCIVLSFTLGCYLASIPIIEVELGDAEANNDKIIANPYEANNDKIVEKKHETNQETNKSNQQLKKLAILVPFRERFPELLDFVPHMFHFLQKQRINFTIFVLQQVDLYRFNRASLINVGYIYTKDNYDYIAMHDVDLLPLNDQLSYKYPERGPMHISAPSLHPKYHYDTYIGGILLIIKEHFALVNGMSNKYWGWGLEDDEFYVRLKDAGLVVRRPENITTGRNDTFTHNHIVSPNHKRDMRKCYNQHNETRRRDRKTGVHDVNYTISSVHNLIIDKYPLTVVNVALKCNNDTTPWCQCPNAPQLTDKKKAMKRKQ